MFGRPAGGYEAANKTIHLLERPTWSHFMHEMFHALLHRAVGSNYNDLPEEGVYGTEQRVFNMMKKFFWSYMSKAEKTNAELYLRSMKGDPDAPFFM